MHVHIFFLYFLFHCLHLLTSIHKVQNNNKKKRPQWYGGMQYRMFGWFVHCTFNNVANKPSGRSQQLLLLLLNRHQQQPFWVVIALVVVVIVVFTVTDYLCHDHHNRHHTHCHRHDDDDDDGRYAYWVCFFLLCGKLKENCKEE